MIAREGHRKFLESAGWGGAEVSPLAGDASFRRYFRLDDRGRRAVLMDAPPEHEDVRPFLKIADLLVGAGFSAPRLIAADREAGFLLIEDFGDRLMGPVLATEPQREEETYAAAVRLLADLKELSPPADLRPYDRAELLREALIFPEWYGKAAGFTWDRESYAAAWDRVWGEVLQETAARPVVTLRDYHADNLMLLPERPGSQSLGLLDFQDALAGHPAYDLVSLLQDARRDVSPRLEKEMLDEYGRAAGVQDRQAFRTSYEVLGAQRNVKILGVFVRLRDRDGRQGYVERLPRVWGYVERNFQHPALAPVKSWFDAHVPADLRAAWCR
ncbi:phosphotransferase [Sandaracinobacter sp. RS1-74]|uniref:aminoglycoside phosphotransferase family protein n=1 Tax=Sandaracinobacteroides sayramensis TaxID=2913411 RepID=UPI001EDB3684|nr:phosphotransferase [Sandaracinobacteroides sayramensis]MCG2840825.1 phosphotransferase [Sandaracinobacteroides sayramensis]